MITRADIVTQARRELGTPWRHQARTPGVAVDCVGFLGVIARGLDLSVAEAWFADDECKRYGRPPYPRTLLALARRYFDEIAIAAARMGDVLVLAHETHPRVPTHFAVISHDDPRRIIHAEWFAGKVIEHGLPPTARWRPTHAFRFREVAA